MMPNERQNLEAQRDRLMQKLARIPRGTQAARTAAFHLNGVNKELAKLPPAPSPEPQADPAPAPEPVVPQP